MVTKIKTLRQSMIVSSNFEQDPSTSSDNTFGFYKGYVQEDGIAKTVSSGSFTLPSGTYYIYVDMNESPPEVKAETEITSGRYIPLYVVTSSGSNLTNIQDIRSWTGASIGDGFSTGSGVGSDTPFDIQINNLNPKLWYRFNESSGDLINNGTLGEGYNATWNEEPAFRGLISGDVNGGTAFGLNPGFSDEQIAMVEIPDWSTDFGSDTEGTWMISFKTGLFNDSFVAMNSASQSLSVDNLIIDMYNDDLEISLNYDGSTDVEVATNSSFPVVDGNWHLVFVVQDGINGIKWFVDGADNTETSPETGTEWFADVVEDFVHLWIGSINNTGSPSQEIQGYLAHVAYFDTALSSSQISDLYDDWSTAA